MSTVPFSLTHWWIAAIVSGLALAWAVQSLATKTKTKLIMAAVVTLGTALYMALRASVDGTQQALQLYIVAALPMAICRLIFARWLRRYRSTPVSEREMLSGGQTALFIVVWAMSVAGVAVLGEALSTA